MKIEEEFLLFWQETFPEIPAISEYRPQKEIYELNVIQSIYRDWLNSENLKDYRFDFAIDLANQDTQLSPLAVEFQGAGFGHTGNQSQRDMKKQNQAARMGILTMTFAVQTVRKNMKYVADEIMWTFEDNFEIL